MVAGGQAPSLAILTSRVVIATLMGGLIGGFLAAWLYCRAKKLDFGRLADMGAAGLAIGTAVGRIGDLVIGDHLGRTTDGFWGWEYKGGELISAPPCDPSVYPSADGCIEPGMVVHQTALYDSVWALVIFFVILRLERKPRHLQTCDPTLRALFQGMEEHEQVPRPLVQDPISRSRP